MNFYETIEPLKLCAKYEVEKVEVISEHPMFADSPWLRIKTKEGKVFYETEKNLEKMNDPTYWYAKMKTVPAGQPAPLK